ncbi:MAG: hypothetical protein M1360_01010 [Candidatus Marsarchaeota archaeon]|nr:hypothetical protein [Candidatus Marsarchaeota archaeon]MCL5418504.1 hypothetical protein [Candidatus Marsarchaeota archaeon]
MYNYKNLPGIQSNVMDNRTYMFVMKSAIEISDGYRILKALQYEKPTGEKDIERMSKGVELILEGIKIAQFQLDVLQNYNHIEELRKALDEGSNAFKELKILRVEEKKDWYEAILNKLDKIPKIVEYLEGAIEYYKPENDIL